jgi:hypothetical protein
MYVVDEGGHRVPNANELNINWQAILHDPTLFGVESGSIRNFQ